MSQDLQWNQFEHTAHRLAAQPLAQRRWAQDLPTAELAYYATRARGWGAVHTGARTFSPQATRHHEEVLALAQVCEEVHQARSASEGTSHARSSADAFSANGSQRNEPEAP